MEAPNPTEIEAALGRLRGHLVTTPLIGGVTLPDWSVPPDLRFKPEVLQPAGSLYFRGAMHYLLRQLGSLKGLVVSGAVRPVLAAATAAALHRLPVFAFPVGEPDAAMWSMLQVTGAEVSPRPSPQEADAAAAELRAREGYRLMPGVEDADYAAGVATVGCELGQQLPDSTEDVVVAPAELAHGIALGMAASGRNLRVQGVEHGVSPAPEGLAAAVRTSMRLDVGKPSVAALHWVLAHDVGADPCVVLAC